MKLPEIKIKFKNSNIEIVKINSAFDCAKLLRKMYDADTLNYEESGFALFLNNVNMIGYYKVSQGGLNATIMDIRKILAVALNCAATKIIISHNHPTGNLKPSDQDLSLTKKLKEAASLMDIQLLDHIIITNKSYYSFADNELL